MRPRSAVDGRRSSLHERRKLPPRARSHPRKVESSPGAPRAEESTRGDVEAIDFAVASPAPPPATADAPVELREEPEECQGAPPPREAPSERLGFRNGTEPLHHAAHPPVELLVPVLEMVGEEKFGNERCADEADMVVGQAVGRAAWLDIPERVQLPPRLCAEGEEGLLEALDGCVSRRAPLLRPPCDQGDDSEAGRQHLQDLGGFGVGVGSKEGPLGDDKRHRRADPPPPASVSSSSLTRARLRPR